MPTLRIPLVGSYMNRNPNAALSDTKDQQFVNGFPETYKNPITGKGELYLNKRQGTTASNDVSAGATGSFGAIVWTANSAAVSPAIFSYLKTGGTDMQFFDTAGSQIGGDVADTQACLSMEETDISGTGNLTAILDDGGVLEAWFFPEGGSWTQIVDAQFPSGITSAHAHMDGFMFVMTEGGQLWHSDVNSLANWTASTFISANSFADNGVGCVRYRNLIMGLGDYSSEFFYNAGNATGSVLSRIDNATLRIGAVRNTTGRGAAIKAVGSTVYWIGTNGDTGARGIYRMNGMQAEKISDDGVDKLVSNGAIRSIAGQFSLNGRAHVAFSGGGASLLCFSDEGFWWTFTPAGPLTVTAMLGAVDSSAFSKSYFSTVTNAKIYTFNPNSPVWQDNGAAYTLTAQTDAVDAGTDLRKFWDGIRIVADRPGSTSNVGVSFSDDDGATFSTPRDIDVNSGQNFLRGWGSSRRRIWKFTHAANTSFRSKAVEIEYRVGAS